MEKPTENTRLQGKYKYTVISAVLFLVIFVLGSLAFFFSMKHIRITDAGRELSRTVELEKLRLEAAINGEVSLVRKMADSSLVREYFLHPDDPALEKIAVEEFAGYGRIFMPKSIFWVNDIDKKFYYNSSHAYTLDLGDPNNYWYAMTLNTEKEINLNINYNRELDTTNLWINAPVLGTDRHFIGMVGAGIDVAAFVDSIYHNYSDDGLLFFFDESGNITGAMNENLVVNKSTLENELGKIGNKIFSMLETLEGENILYFTVPDGVAALGSIPGFDWYICSVLPVGLKEILGTSMSVLFAVLLLVVAGIFIIFNLIHINVVLEKERNIYRNISIVDGLTGIYNRRYLEENLERLIKSMSRSNGRLSLLMLDIDYFKKYNDTYGHNMGDTCLKTVATIMAQSVARSDDFVARYGGEEFVIVLPNVDESGASTVAQRVLANICAKNIPHIKSDVAKFLTVSIGGVTANIDHTHTGEDYIRKADEALYVSKENGRNRYTAAHGI